MKIPTSNMKMLIVIFGIHGMASISGINHLTDLGGNNITNHTETPYIMDIIQVFTTEPHGRDNTTVSSTPYPAPSYTTEPQEHDFTTNSEDIFSTIHTGDLFTTESEVNDLTTDNDDIFSTIHNEDLFTTESKVNDFTTDSEYIFTTIRNEDLFTTESQVNDLTTDNSDIFSTIHNGDLFTTESEVNDLTTDNDEILSTIHNGDLFTTESKVNDFTTDSDNIFTTIHNEDLFTTDFQDKDLTTDNDHYFTTIHNEDLFTTESSESKITTDNDDYFTTVDRENLFTTDSQENDLTSDNGDIFTTIHNVELSTTESHENEITTESENYFTTKDNENLFTTESQESTQQPFKTTTSKNPTEVMTTSTQGHTTTKEPTKEITSSTFEPSRTLTDPTEVMTTSTHGHTTDTSTTKDPTEVMTTSTHGHSSDTSTTKEPTEVMTTSTHGHTTDTSTIKESTEVLTSSMYEPTTTTPADPTEVMTTSTHGHTTDTSTTKDPTEVMTTSTHGHTTDTSTTIDPTEVMTSSTFKFTTTTDATDAMTTDAIELTTSHHSGDISTSRSVTSTTTIATTEDPCPPCDEGICNSEDRSCDCFPFHIGDICNTEVVITPVMESLESDITDGSTVTVVCDLTLDDPNDPSDPIDVVGMWKVGDNIITNSNDETLRFYYSNIDDGENQWKSTLVINPVRSWDNGEITCFGTIPSSGYAMNYSDSDQLDVLTKPIASLTPLRLTTTDERANSNGINFTCSIFNSTFYPRAGEVVWEYNEDEISADEPISTDYDSTLTITEIASKPTGTEKDYDITCKVITNSDDTDIESDEVVSVLTIHFTDAPVCHCQPNTTLGLPETLENENVNISCGRDQQGYKIAPCIKAEPRCGWGTIDETNCVDRNYTLVIRKILDVINAGASSGAADSVLEELDDLTTVDTDDGDGITEGNIKGSVEAVFALAVARDGNAENDPITDDEIGTAIAVVSNIVDGTNYNSWDRMNSVENDSNTATSLLQTVDTYSTARMKSIDLGAELVIPESNIGLNMRSINRGNKPSSDSLDHSMCSRAKFLEYNLTFTTEYDGITIPDNSLKDSQVQVGCTIYKTMHNIIPSRTSNIGTGYGDVVQGNHTRVSSLIFANSSHTELNPPIQISFVALNETVDLDGTFIYEPVCAFWNESSREWETDGCEISDDSTEFQIICKCNHTTSFKAFFKAVRDFLVTLASYIGCFFSIIEISAVEIFYVIFWKHLRTKSSLIRANLCIALTFTNIAFMTLMNLHKELDEEICTTLTTSLHYFFLVGMFVMLAEGLQLFMCVQRGVPTDDKAKYYKETYVLLAMAWLVPIAIVGVTIGAVGSDRYTMPFEKHCWVNLENNVVYGFVGPAGLVFVVNIIILVIVVRALVKSRNNVDEGKAADRSVHKKSIFNIVVLTPLLGFTWILALFVFNDKFADYVFSAFNTSEGVFSVALNLITDKKVRRVLLLLLAKRRLAKMKKKEDPVVLSMATFDDTVREHHDDDAAQTGMINPTYHKQVFNSPDAKFASNQDTEERGILQSIRGLVSSGITSNTNGNDRGIVQSVQKHRASKKANDINETEDQTVLQSIKGKVSSRRQRSIDDSDDVDEGGVKNVLHSVKEKVSGRKQRSTDDSDNVDEGGVTNVLHSVKEKVTAKRQGSTAPVESDDPLGDIDNDLLAMFVFTKGLNPLKEQKTFHLTRASVPMDSINLSENKDKNKRESDSEEEQLW